MELTKFSFLRRRPGLSAEAFAAHWRQRHVQVLVEQGGHRDYNRRYVQNLVTLPEPGGADAPLFDGIAQMLPADAQVVSKGFQQDPRYARFVRPDEILFLDPTACVVAYAESTTLRSRRPVSARKVYAMYASADPGTRGTTSLAQESLQHHVALLHRLAPDLVAELTLHKFLPGAVVGMEDGRPTTLSESLVGVAEIRFSPGGDSGLDELVASTPLLRQSVPCTGSKLRVTLVEATESVIYDMDDADPEVTTRTFR